MTAETNTILTFLTIYKRNECFGLYIFMSILFLSAIVLASVVAPLFEAGGSLTTGGGMGHLLELWLNFLHLLH